MIIRSAVLEGTVDAESRHVFDAYMSSVVLPAITAYPKLRKVLIRTPVESDEGAPQVYMVFDLYFDSLEDMRAALASPVRQQVREIISAGMKGFQGRVYHIVYSEGLPLKGQK